MESSKLLYGLIKNLHSKSNYVVSFLVNWDYESTGYEQS